LIPRTELEGSQRQLLTHTTTFDDALTVIYETVGCAEVKVKPVLTYKLSTAANKDTPISLSSDADWDGCLDEVTAAENDKKKSVTVKINVTDQVSRIRICLLSLSAV
jgi:hypothetical protein